MTPPWRKLARRWQAVAPAERRRYRLVAGVTLAGLIALFHGLVTGPALVKAEGDLTRLKGRAAKQAKQDAAPPVPRLAGKSAAQLKREVDGLRVQLDAQRARLAELAPRFAPLDRLEEHQRLRLALTALANGSDLEVLRLEQKGVAKEERELAPTPERIRALAEATPYKRPLMRFEARASYRGLMQFLDGLKALPYLVSPVWIAVEVKTDAVEGQAPRRQWLELAVDLAL